MQLLTLLSFKERRLKIAADVGYSWKAWRNWGNITDETIFTKSVAKFFPELQRIHNIESRWCASRNSPQQNWHQQYWKDIFLLTSTLHLKIKFVCMNIRISIFMLQLRLIIKIGFCYITYKWGNKKLNKKKVNKRCPKVCSTTARASSYIIKFKGIGDLITQSVIVSCCKNLHYE